MLSVCVPIYNEEENVERIVKNIQETDLWKRSRQKEILLGINGSTDHSAAIARRMARADPRIRVFIIPEKSKNKAWEKMVQESNPISERLFFADADVILESSTFSRINEAMEKSPTMAVIGARSVPLPESNWLSIHRRMLVKGLQNLDFSERKGSLWGQCYGIQRKDALTVQLPTDSRIAEDIFLELFFYERSMVIPGARVHIRMPNFLDHVRQRTRGHIWVRLIKEQYPTLYERYLEIRRTRKRYEFRKIMKGATPFDLLAVALNQGAEKYAGLRAGRLIKKGKGSWPKMTSTKTLPAPYRKGQPHK